MEWHSIKIRQFLSLHLGSWSSVRNMAVTTVSISIMGYNNRLFDYIILWFHFSICLGISYTACNITGRPSKFPNYGDFPETFAMVSDTTYSIIPLLVFFFCVHSSKNFNWIMFFFIANLRSMVGHGAFSLKRYYAANSKE